ncbi:MAG: hypothetical protein KAR87_04700 [Candidatus Aenigmarchaeota archaeon]|nr:hypothetical protein [Candidatus Aenigmarchaeota archaeon]
MDSGKKKEKDNNEKKDEEKKEEKDENVITHEDFEKLESEETKIKTGLLDKLKSYVKPKKEEFDEEDKEESDEDLGGSSNSADIKRLQSQIDKLTKELESRKIDTEKIDAKLDSEKEIRSAVTEQVNELSEKMGELRSMILDREKSFNEIETRYTQMKLAVEAIDPKRIKNKFEKIELVMTEVGSSVEKNNEIIKKQGKDINIFEEQMSKIKSFDNIVNVFKEISKKAERVRETELYINQTSSKLESMFFEFEKNLVKIDDLESRLNSFDEVGKELMLTTSSIEEGQRNYLKKKDQENIQKEILKEVQTRLSKEKEGYDKTNNALNNRLDDFDKIKDKLADQMNKKAKEKHDEMEKYIQSKTSQLDTEIRKINSMLEIPSFQIFLKNIEDNKTLDEVMLDNKKEAKKYINKRMDELKEHETRMMNEIGTIKKEVSAEHQAKSNIDIKNKLEEFDKMIGIIDKTFKEKQKELNKHNESIIQQINEEIKGTLLENRDTIEKYIDGRIDDVEEQENMLVNNLNEIRDEIAKEKESIQNDILHELSSILLKGNKNDAELKNKLKEIKETRKKKENVNKSKIMPQKKLSKIDLDKKNKGMHLNEKIIPPDAAEHETPERLLDDNEKRINKYLESHGYDIEKYGIN